MPSPRSISSQEEVKKLSEDRAGSVDELEKELAKIPEAKKKELGAGEAGPCKEGGSPCYKSTEGRGSGWVGKTPEGEGEYREGLWGAGAVLGVGSLGYEGGGCLGCDPGPGIQEPCGMVSGSKLNKDFTLAIAQSQHLAPFRTGFNPLAELKVDKTAMLEDFPDSEEDEGEEDEDAELKKDEFYEIFKELEDEPDQEKTRGKSW